MNIGLLELTSTALRKVSYVHGDGHLINPSGETLDDALRTAAIEINAAPPHLRLALAAVQPTINATTRPCACEACEITAMHVDSAIQALREPLP